MTNIVKKYYTSEMLSSGAFVRYARQLERYPSANLVILSGAPYSGKTFFRQNFMSYMDSLLIFSPPCNWQFLSHDDCRLEHADKIGIPYDYTFANKKENAIIKQMIKEREDKIRTCPNIIVDMMNLTYKQRKRCIDVFGEGRKITVVSFDPPNRALLYTRMEQRPKQFVNANFAMEQAERQTIPDLEQEGVDYLLRVNKFGNVYVFADRKTTFTSDNKRFMTFIDAKEDEYG